MACAVSSVKVSLSSMDESRAVKKDVSGSLPLPLAAARRVVCWF